jgi:hypothetical protein
MRLLLFFYHCIAFPKYLMYNMDYLIYRRLLMTVMTQETTLVRTKLFPESMWAEISGCVAEAFRMTVEEKERFAGGRIAKLIAAIPFLAGCEDAERTAVAHLGTYLLSTRETKRYFNARPEDGVSVLERLRLGSNFMGGDGKIIEKGLCLLALNMVSDYKRDIEEDARLGKYNPIAARAWDFESTVEELEYKIVSVTCEEMDDIAPIVEIPLDWWSPQ